MFETNTSNDNNEQTTPPNESVNKYKNIIIQPNSSANLYSNEVNYNIIDKMLEKEKQHNKTESWNKLDKTVKIQKLHTFAEKYGKENNLSVKDVKGLKTFFIECLEKNKLQKTKDVNYDKDTHHILSIPSLFYNHTNRNFTLKIMDSKRVSTLKSLTPKRINSLNNITNTVQENKKEDI